MSIDNGVVRNTTYVFAPLLPYARIREHFNSDALEKNIISHKMYLSALPSLGGAYVADFNMLGSLDADWFHRSLHAGEVERLVSLSDSGFYFLLAKLTAHFLRASAPE